jgi:lipopolysaccharide transport system ATP-binding protein/teichoic acid transport system ATP-binding protein
LPSASEPSNVAVRVADLSVRFRTTHEKSPTLRASVVNTLRRTRTGRTVDALKDVSFEVPTGSVYGVIGRNGAGKSTLFRTIAGILPPTKGRITIWGRVTPLLSLGVGFNRELTGRENILLGGLAAGLDVSEIAAHYAEIVEFAELGDALNYPMRTYSSGMFARLGFAIAVHLDPEILLIDEALAAGDAKFKNKSFDKILELCAREATVLIVSHGMQVVKQLADGCLWLDRGEARMEGSTDEVIEAYLVEMGDPMANKAATMEDF